MNRKLAILALLAVVLVAAAWLLQQSQTEPLPDVDATAEVAATPPPADGAEATSLPDRASRVESRVAGEDPLRDGAGATPGDLAPHDVVAGEVRSVVRRMGRDVLAGAKITVFPWLPGTDSALRDQTPLASSVSGVDGKFVVTGLPWAMRFWARIEAKGHAPCSAVLFRGEPRMIELYRLGAVRGVITRGPARDPVPALTIESTLYPVYVSASLYRLAPEAVVTRTDNLGEFELAAPIERPMSLLLRLPGELPLLVGATATEGKRLEIHIDGPRQLLGQVVDLVSGLPVVGASISSHCKTDAIGHFELTTAASENTLEVTAPGYASVTARLSVLTPGRQRIAMLREAVVEGRVRDGLGRPVAGAAVTLALWHEALRDRDRLSVHEMYGKCGKVTPPPKGASTVHEPPFHGPVRTDRDGHFRFAGVGAGAGVIVCRALVSSPGFADAESELLEVPFPGGRADVDLVLRRAGRVHGTVRLQGVPMARARVQVDAADGLRLETRCDPLGRYALAGIPEGEAELEALVETLSPVRERKRVAVAGGSDQVLDFGLEPNSTVITGRIVARGPPLGKLLAGLVEESAAGAARRYHGPVDEQGGFRIPVPGDAAARYTLSFGAGRGRVQGGRSGVSPGADVGIIEVTEACRLHLKLVDAATGVSLAASRCRWRLHDSAIWEEAEMSPHDRGGGFDIWLPWGRLDLRVEPVSAEHEPCESSGVNVAQNQPMITLSMARRSGR